MEDYKPCAHCGGQMHTSLSFVHDGKGSHEGYRATCKSCRCSTDIFRTEAEAVKAANRRPSPSTAPLTLEELRKMDGEPVWVTFGPEFDPEPVEPIWMLVSAEDRRLTTENEWVDFYDVGYQAYRRKPEEENNAEN